MLEAGDPARLASLGKPAIDAVHEAHKLLKTRQQVGALAGELLDVEEVRTQLAALCAAVRRSYERLPELVATRVCAMLGESTRHAEIEDETAGVCRSELSGLELEFERMVAEVVREQRRAMDGAEDDEEGDRSGSRSGGEAA